MLRCLLLLLLSCHWESWLLPVPVCHQWVWMDTLNVLHCLHSLTILRHFSHTLYWSNTFYTHWTGKCKFWPLSTTPPTINKPQPSVLPCCKLAAVQSCSQVKWNQNTVQNHQMVFWNVSSQVSISPTVSSLACSCSKQRKDLRILFKSLLYLTIIELQNTYCKTLQSVETCSSHPASRIKPGLHLPVFLYA
jgi:hypothetical protein